MKVEIIGSYWADDHRVLDVREAKAFFSQKLRLDGLEIAHQGWSLDCGGADGFLSMTVNGISPEMRALLPRQELIVSQPDAPELIVSVSELVRQPT